jgi:hypothetical protein
MDADEPVWWPAGLVTLAVTHTCLIDTKINSAFNGSGKHLISSKITHHPNE